MSAIPRVPPMITLHLTRTSSRIFRNRSLRRGREELLASIAGTSEEVPTPPPWIRRNPLAWLDILTPRAFMFPTMLCERHRIPPFRKKQTRESRAPTVSWKLEKPGNAGPPRLRTFLSSPSKSRFERRTAFGKSYAKATGAQRPRPPMPRHTSSFQV